MLTERTNVPEQKAVLLQLIEELGAELRSHRPADPITLDSTLDGDLGFDSLSRAELLSRIESCFQVALPERTFAEAETPRDLLRLLERASPTAPTQVPAPATPLEATEGVPSQALSLVEVLAWHVERHPDRPHIHFYNDQGNGPELTYGQLWQEARSVAARLLQHGLAPDQSVALMLPTGRDYFVSFFGILMSGAIPVPIYPPMRPSQLEDHLNRQASILDNCQARLLIAPPEANALSRLLKAQVPSLADVMAPQSPAHAAPAQEPIEKPVMPKRDDIALLQYTSGSTGSPKGVILSHANLLANIRTAGKAIDASSRDVCVSWLPLYHDMGLIGAWLGSLYHAALLISLPPESFLGRPARWLQALSRHGGTLSAAPNFAYELCLNKVPDSLLDELDLSHWRLAMNGAEAVNAHTLRRFCRRFAKCGFDAKAMYPVYGLAECSLALAFPAPDSKPHIDRVQRAPLMRDGHALPASDTDTEVVEFVCCGQPLPAHRIRICDEGGRELPSRFQGRLQFQGPSACSGYYRNSSATARLFDGDWLDSGDLGYLAEEGLYITGRSKDLIIRSGRNLYPEELESAVGTIDGLRRGRVAAFGVSDQASGSERLIVMAETRADDEGERERLRHQAANAVSRLIGEPPDEVVLTPPGILLKTSSGKLRRSDCRERYIRGDYRIRTPGLQLLRMLLKATTPQLQRLRRSLGRHLFAGYALLTGLTLTTAAFIAVLLLPNLKRRWYALHRISRCWAWLTRTPLHIRGLENISADAPCVLVVNHASYLDAFVLIATLPHPVHFVAKAELRTQPLPRTLLDRLAVRYINRQDPQQSLNGAREATNLAQKGHRLLFFPEGTLQESPGLMPFKMGAFVSAVDAGIPVIPVAISGTRSILRGQRWYGYRGEICVVIGIPLYPDKEGERWTRALTLRDAARAHILRHCHEPDLER
ncbi:AMP-binding protein [Marinobacterium sp. D7]|uniref:AMP-binding protein n=1 Tax=Marinobacterium ramblicola TaxID=2849041 RepID=UPI001C2D2107|nr:AMP-binding protein [Marinobacterium ramblicola]MBV1786633.1 AMP-binding protein [Marinobacterium ramblicola]